MREKLRLEYRHNNAYDAVVLVDLETNMVRSDWPVTPEVMNDFCDCSQEDTWDDRRGDEHKADEYGKLVAYREGHTLTAVDTDLWSERVQFIFR